MRTHDTMTRILFLVAGGLALTTSTGCLPGIGSLVGTGALGSSIPALPPSLATAARPTAIQLPGMTQIVNVLPGSTSPAPAAKAPARETLVAADTAGPDSAQAWKNSPWRQDVLQHLSRSERGQAILDKYAADRFGPLLGPLAAGVAKDRGRALTPGAPADPRLDAAAPVDLADYRDPADGETGGEF